MTDSPADDLGRLLNSPLPPSFAELTPEQLADLTGLVEAGLQHRIDALTTDAFGALDNLPVFLRGAVRKVVGL
ncbi:hypothetical protein ACFU44_22610 [Nocardia rhizosphaerihabitans]|uniref:hypothetical protein n=1 Tax=Nocardia rhizosphaerihabitans TaxID=1691570 RepID=UPI00366E7B0A